MHGHRRQAQTVISTFLAFPTPSLSPQNFRFASRLPSASPFPPLLPSTFPPVFPPPPSPLSSCYVRTTRPQRTDRTRAEFVTMSAMAPIRLLCLDAFHNRDHEICFGAWREGRGTVSAILVESHHISWSPCPTGDRPMLRKALTWSPGVTHGAGGVDAVICVSVKSPTLHVLFACFLHSIQPIRARAPELRLSTLARRSSRQCHPTLLSSMFGLCALHGVEGFSK